MSLDIPTGWRHATLDEFLEESRVPGGTGATADKLTIKLYGGGVHAKDDRGQGSENTKYFRRSAGQFIYSKLDFLNGAFGVVPECLDGRESTADLPSFDIRGGISPEWLLYFVGRPAFYLPQRSAAIGSRKARRVGPEEFLKIPIPLPPLAEQKKIAAILSSVDEAIRANEAVIEQTRRVKEGLLQELLTRGVGHTEFRETEIGPLPTGWSVARVDDVSDAVSVGIVVRPAQYYAESGVKCWRSCNVGAGYMRDESWVFIDEVSNVALGKSRLNAGDVLVVRTGRPGASCVVPNEMDGTNCIDILFVRPKHSVVDSWFLSWTINSQLGRKQVLAGQGGLAQQHFNVGALKRMALPLPSIGEQREIVSAIAGVAASESSSIASVDRLQSLKIGLLQDLLTGKVRVSV